MALSQIFIKPVRQIKTQKVIDDEGFQSVSTTVQLDAYILESHDNTLSITENPVELKAKISDHAIINPKKLRIVAEVSNTPLGFESFLNFANNFVTTQGLSGVLTRSQKAYIQLVELQELRELIEVQTGLKKYTNMLIESIKVDQDKDSSNSVEAVIDLREVLIVRTQVKKLEKEALKDSSAIDQGSPAEKAGRKNQTSPSSEKEGGYLLALYKWVNGA